MNTVTLGRISFIKFLPSEFKFLLQILKIHGCNTTLGGAPTDQGMVYAPGKPDQLNQTRLGKLD